MRKRVKLFQWLGAGLLALFALTNAQSEIGMSGNEASRFATIQAVAEQHTFAIERTNFRTVDKVFFDGHQYSDKPPFLAWAVGVALRPLLAATGWNFADHYYRLVYLVDLLTGGTVNILLFLWLFNMFRRVKRGSVEAKFLLALGSVIGNWLLSYSVVINNHTPAALCVLGAYVALWKFSRRPTYKAAALAALACGILGALEIPGGVIFSLALIPALALTAPKDKRTEYLLTAACVVGAAALAVFALNYVAYRRPLPLYIAPGGSFSPGVGQKSFLGYAFECLFTYRGVFSYQPFLLLALPGLWSLRRKIDAAEWSVLGATAAFAVFYLVLTNEFGGAAYGFRYLIPVLPVWSFHAGRWVLSAPVPRARLRRGLLALVLILWGVVTSLAGAYNPFCFAYEGYRTPPGHFSRSVRSTFGGNLLCWSYEHFPDSSLTRALRRHYGERASWEHLHWSFFSMKNIDMLARLRRERGIAVEKAGGKQYFIERHNESVRSGK